MSQYQSYAQRQQQQQGVPQPQNTQQRTQVPTTPQTTNLYIFNLILVIQETQATMKAKPYKKPFCNGQVLEMVEEMSSFMENQILLFLKT